MIKILFLTISLVISTLTMAKEQDKRIHLWLSGYEWSLEPADISKLGPNPEQILMQIAQDKSLLSYYHFRALKALTLFPSDEVASFLENYTKSIPSISHQRRGFQSFATAFQNQYPERVASLASILLQSGNPQSRIAAYQVFQQLPQHIAEPYLQAFDLKQQPEWVVEQLNPSSASMY